MLIRYGELEDMISCLLVYNGQARFKNTNTVTRHVTNYDDAILIR